MKRSDLVVVAAVIALLGSGCGVAYAQEKQAIAVGTANCTMAAADGTNLSYNRTLFDDWSTSGNCTAQGTTVIFAFGPGTRQTACNVARGAAVYVFAEFGGGGGSPLGVFTDWWANSATAGQTSAWMVYRFGPAPADAVTACGTDAAHCTISGNCTIR